MTTLLRDPNNSTMTRMDRDTRERLIERYRQGALVVTNLVIGLSDDELDRVPGDGGWSPREVVHHLGDSEMTSAIRLRRLLSEDAPEIAGYDEAEYARRLHYRDRPIGPALEALAAARATSAQILDRLTEEDWDRAGTHSESGTYSVATWLEVYAAHAHDHADQIRTGLTG